MEISEFLSRSCSKHNSRYIYCFNQTDTIYYKDKFTAKCIEHGDIFTQDVGNHLSGKTSCKGCSKDKRRRSRSLSQEEFILKVADKFSDTLDLSEAVYVNNSTPVQLTCLKHNHKFSQRPSQLFLGKVGCKHCLRESGTVRDLTLEEVMESINEAHKGNLDLSKATEYGHSIKPHVRCIKHDHWFSGTTFKKLSMGQTGCPHCKKEKISDNQKLNLGDVLARFKESWGDDYDYSDVTYIGKDTPVNITCNKHQLKFQQTPKSHWSGNRGCPECQKEYKRSLYSMTKDEFIKRSEKVYGDSHDYSLTELVNGRTPVKIVCNEHNQVFEQSPESHLRGHLSCPKCSWTGRSRSEDGIVDLIRGWGVDVIQGDRKTIHPMEIDILMPEHKLAIEYNGVYYHSDSMKDKNYHKEKYDRIKESGYDFITIWEHDWNDVTKRPVIIEIIKSRLGLSERPRIGARSCEVVKVNHQEASDFLDVNHIQGSVANGYTKAYGLTYSGKLVAVMTFKDNLGTYTLSRFATSCFVMGGASKLFKRFIKDHQPHTVISFSDNEVFNGGLYETLGFTLDKVIPIDYKVYHNKTGIRHKSAWRRSVLPKRLEEIGSNIQFNPTTDTRTEWQIEDEVRALRLWDCGKKRWVWKNT